jgi:NADPH-dependent 2,4-dienoyl-CoA reductase/sulfur reductase-like enzyme/rhodanese-related sulfurtransferase/two-component sensor histidine kinase
MAVKDEELERLEEQLRKYKGEVERLLKDRSEYLRVSAHQMKSPIATILFSVETLLGNYAGPLNSKQLRVVESIRNGSRDLQALIMDILELERFRTGEVELEEVDFTEICLEAVEELKEKIQSKDIKLLSDIPRKRLITRGHRVGLKHAVYNLMENAVKYSNRQGMVRFSVMFDEAGALIRTVVEDHGIGIPAQEQEKVFEEFYRAPNARLFDKHGTGFGMTLVKQIIDICGGGITLSSRENEGTTVTFELPLLEVGDPEEYASEKEKQYRRKIIVVGGVAAGPKAASRARRLDPNAKITVYEMGTFLAYAGCALPFYISGQLKRQRELFKSFSGLESATEFFRNVKGIEVRNLSHVTAIDREQKRIEYREVLTDRVLTEPYDVLVLATGSTPFIPDISGIDRKNIFVLHGVTDSENIKRSIANELAKEIVIIGGGKIGVETAEALTVSGARVTIVEKEGEILPFLDIEMAALVHRYLEQKGIRVVTGADVLEFMGGDRVESVRLYDLTLPADVVILATGFKPNTKLARDAGLRIGSTGAISVNEYLQTSDPCIYAAGDCAEVINAVAKKPFYLPLGSIANRQGRIAGSNAAGRKLRFRPVTGTTIIKVFDFHFAKTGLSERQARDNGFDPITVYVPGYDRDVFMPGAEMINIKMIADRGSRKLLGVQIVGLGDVDKRIDVASTVLAHDGKVEDVISLDLGYAPAHSQAMDSLITAAHVMENKLDGLFAGLAALDAKEFINTAKSCVCIDVRTPQEYEEERIPGVESIPLESLRRRIDEIPRDRGIVLVDDTGSEAYQASLILKAQGFSDVRILEGGLRMWPFRITRE